MYQATKQVDNMLCYVTICSFLGGCSHGQSWTLLLGIILLLGNDYYDYIIIPQQCP